MIPKVLNARQFAKQIYNRHNDNCNVRFAFVLGAGASRDAGVKTGQEYVDEWIPFIRDALASDSSGPIEQWATEENLGIKGFDFHHRAKYYFQLYDQRFQHPKDGFAYLEKELADVTPSYGHFVLAQMLAGQAVGARHNVVLTTNFDNLIERAIYWFTHSYPLVLGHSSLASFADTRITRPTILKVHNDLLMNPMNREAEMANLATSWRPVIVDLFKNFAPVFVGYDGHDHTLMGLLESLKPDQLTEGFYWGWYVRAGETDPQRLLPRQEVLDLIAKFKGSVFTHQGLDCLMWEFQEAFKLPDALRNAEAQFEIRRTRYQEKKEIAVELVKQLATNPSESRAVEEEAARQASEMGDTAVAALTRIWAEKDLPKALDLTNDALDRFPNAPRLLFAKAYMLVQLADAGILESDAYVEAERLWREAIRIDPKYVAVYNNLGWLIDRRVRGGVMPAEKLDEAEMLFREALKLDPRHNDALHNLARLLFDKAELKGNDISLYDEIERLYRSAIEYEPKDAKGYSNLGILIVKQADSGFKAPEAYEEAERYFRKSIDVNPAAANAYYALAHLLKSRVDAHSMSKESLAEAINLLEACIRLDPKHQKATKLLEQIKAT